MQKRFSKKQKLQIAQTLGYALDILAQDYSAHDGDEQEIKNREKQIQEEIELAEEWIFKTLISDKKKVKNAKE